MSAHDSVSKKKQKKAERDAERQNKGKKRKREEVENRNDQAQDELQQDFIPLDGGLGVIDVVGDGAGETAGGVDDTQNDDVPARISKAKKRRKTKHNSTEQGEDGGTADAPSNGKKHRFILFIGNLPYSATDASINEHFKKLTPFTLRHRTDPKTKKSKGFAFLEFENFDRLKTCIKLYHHSVFDDVKSDANAGAEGDGKRRKEKGGRRINVELTAGGGGSKEGRKEKIRVKNVRLEEQRKRQLEEQWKAKEKEKARKMASEGFEGSASAAPKAKQTKQVAVADDTAAMHPSRAARLTK